MSPTPFHTLDSYRIELIRKGIHLCSLSIPIIYFFIEKKTALTLLLPLMFAFTIVDILRYYHQPIRKWFYKTFGWLLRQHETDEQIKRLNGATYVLIAACLTVWIFPKIITVTCFSVLIISDIAAALIGMKFGKRKFLSKSLEGSAAFFLGGVLVIVFTPKISYQVEEYLIGFFAVTVGMLVEASPLKIDDNISIPLSVGAVLWLMYLLILPSANLYQFA